MMEVTKTHIYMYICRMVISNAFHSSFNNNGGNKIFVLVSWLEYLVRRKIMKALCKVNNILLG